MASTAWQARHGLTATQYQSEFNSLLHQGYRLRDVSASTVQGQDRFAAIWEQAAGPAWQARHGLDATHYQAEFDTLRQQGYRLVRVCGYGDGGAARFAGVWEQSNGPAWVAHHNMTPADYQTEFNKWLAEGYRLKDVSGYLD